MGFNLDGSIGNSKNSKGSFNLGDKSKITYIPLTTENGTDFGEVSYSAIKAIENNTLDSYLPKNDKEKEVIYNYRLATAGEVKKDDGTSLGFITQEGLKAIAENNTDKYKPINEDEGKAIKSYVEYATQKRQQTLDNYKKTAEEQVVGIEEEKSKVTKDILQLQRERAAAARSTGFNSEEQKEKWRTTDTRSATEKREGLSNPKSAGQQELEGLENKKKVLNEKADDLVDTINNIEKYATIVYNDKGWIDQARANYAKGRLSQDTAQAYNDYTVSQTEESRMLADALSALSEQFEYNNKNALTTDDEDTNKVQETVRDWVSVSFANYLPQLFDQTKASVKGATEGAIAGAVIAGTATGGTGAGAGAIWGARAGWVAGASKQMYETTRGMVFKTLIDAGYDEETALAAANDEAFVSSIIEGAGEIVSMATLGTGKLFSKIAPNAVKKVSGNVVTKGIKGFAQKTGKKISENIFLNTTVKVAGVAVNALGEYAEEYSQEAVSIANERRLQNPNARGKFNLASETLSVLKYQDEETANRLHSAGTEGFRIGLMMGGSTVGGNALGSTALGHISDARTGMKIKKADANESGFVQSVIDIGLNQDQNSKAYKLATKLNESEKVSSPKLGKLAKSNKGETVNVGETYYDTKSKGYINIVSRDEKNTTVTMVDSDGVGFAKEFSNEAVDNLTKNNRYVMVANNMQTEVEQTSTDTETTSVETPTVENTTVENGPTEDTNITNIRTILSGEKLTNKQVDNIINGQASREAFIQFTGIELKGTKAEQRAIIREWHNQSTTNTVESTNVATTEAPVEATATTNPSKEIEDFENMLVAKGVDNDSRQKIMSVARNIQPLLAQKGKTLNDFYNGVSFYVTDSLGTTETSTNENRRKAYWTTVARTFETPSNTNVDEHIDTYVSRADNKTSVIVDAIESTLKPDAKETIFRAMEKQGFKGDLTEFAKKLKAEFEKKGSLGKMADYFTDNGQEVIYAIERGMDTSDVKETKRDAYKDAKAKKKPKASKNKKTTESVETSETTDTENSSTTEEVDVAENTTTANELDGVEIEGDTQIKWDSLNARQKQAIAFIKGLAQASGMRLVLVAHNEKFDGAFSIKDNTIYIDIFAGVNPITKANNIIIPTMSHEITHWMEHKSPELWKKVNDLVFSTLQQADGISESARIKAEQKRLKGVHGKNVSESVARSEIIARSCEDMLSMSEQGKKIFNSLSETEQQTFVAKVKEIIQNLLEWVDDFLSSYESNKPEAKLMRQYKDKLNELSKLWDEMLVDSIKTNQTLEASGMFEHDAELGEAVYDAVDIVYNEKFVESHIKQLEEKHSDESTLSVSEILSRYKKITDIWKKLGGELKSDFLDDWNNRVGKDRAFTVFKAQSGYKYNVELSSMCKKGIPLFEAIDRIVRKEVMQELKNKKLGKAEKEILYDILKTNGFEIPCAICYVEQARQREGDIISAFLNGKIEKTKSGKVTTYKLGWNETLGKIQDEMKKAGVDYTFPTLDRSVATENYTPADIGMDEATQEAYFNALKKIANAEIRRYNKENKKNIKLITKTDAESLKGTFRGNLPLNLRMFKTLFFEPSSRFIIGEDLLYSSMTTLNLASYHNGLYSVFNSQGGTGGYKTKQGSVIYWGDILEKKWASADLRKEGGVRNQSNSDFLMYTLLDHAQMYLDFTAKGYYLQAYTKVLAELKLFGLSNGKHNASLIPKVIVYQNEDGSIDVEKTMLYAGLDENGNPIYDDIEGIPHEEAFMLIEDEEYSKSIGGVCIGYSDNHILKLLDDGRIQLIIGFHDKTNDTSKRYRGAKYAENYNGLNEATNKKSGETKHIGFNQFVQKAENKFKGKESITYNGKTYTWNDVPKLAADLYLEHCDKKGLYPAYSQLGEGRPDFSKHPNYYKLLADFSLYDSKGNYAPHQKVEFNMPDQVPYLEENGKKAYMPTEKYIKQELQKEIAVRDSISEKLADDSEDGIIKQFIQRVNAFYENGGVDTVLSEKVTDEETLNFLENQETMKVYRAMQVIDGKLYPPMAAKVKNADGKKELVYSSEIGVWEQSTERPDLIKSGKFELNKANGSSPIEAAYNPYIHTSASPLNDQFSSAYKRENLVTVEGEIPVSELTSGYRAEFAKNSVGETKWHSGPVASKLKGDKARRVFLSRWFKPTRIVPDSEVASIIAKTLEGENISIPYKVVTPSLRKQLEKEGVSILYSEKDYAPTFYSHMSKVVADIKQEKLGANSVVSYLKGKGVKNEEIKWSGIEEFLEGKKSVTKAELQEFVAGNQLKIEEKILDNRKTSFTFEQHEQLNRYDSERFEIVRELKREWKNAIGTDLPIENTRGQLESYVVSLLNETNLQLRESTDSGKEMVEAERQLRNIFAGEDFGFDFANEAFSYARRKPREFMENYELTDEQKSIFERFITAKENFKNVEGIPIETQRHLKDIASKADDIGRKIHKMESELIKENEKYSTKWDEYKIEGGSNYREIVFKIPDSTYSNPAMKAHWNDSNADGGGVLAHARIQDFEVDGKKMLFIEEIQSDWHNEGAKRGYSPSVEKLKNQQKELYAKRNKLWNDDVDLAESNMTDEEYKEAIKPIRQEITETTNKIEELTAKIKAAENGYTVPDAPFKDNYHEYVLKRLIRMAAEQGYDSIGWTPADVQSARWSGEYAEGYRIEYDQDIPKFLNKYGKKWGAKVGRTPMEIDGKTEANYYVDDRGNKSKSYNDLIDKILSRHGIDEADFLDYHAVFDTSDTIKIQNSKDGSYLDEEIHFVSEPTSVWSMDLTDSMKDSVLYEGQVLYAEKDAEYLELAKEPEKNKAKLDKMVEEAAIENGFPTKLYHGTNRFGFTQPRTTGVENNQDWSPFFATDSVDTAGTYSVVSKERRIYEQYEDDSMAEDYIEEVDAQIDDAIGKFCANISKYFSEWFFGRDGGNSYVRSVVEKHDSDVYGYLTDMVADAYYQYGDDYKNDYDEFAEWQEDSNDWWEIESSIIAIESLVDKKDKVYDVYETSGIYGLYANTTGENIGFLEIDCKGANWNHISYKDIPLSSEEIAELENYEYQGYLTIKPFVNTRWVARTAKSLGYEGVIFKNIVDNGGYGKADASNVYVFFKPEVQVKSADAVTYYDREETDIIPLSERFSTEFQDIRYSEKDGRWTTDRDDNNNAKTTKEKIKEEATDIANKAIDVANKIPGVDIDHIEDGNANIADIVQMIKDNFDVPISTGKVTTPNARGIYKVQPEAIRVKIANNLPTISHELGHHLDKIYNFALSKLDSVKQLRNAVSQDFLNQYPENQRNAEAVAEFVRTYLRNTNEAKDLCYDFYNDFVKTLSKEDLKMVDIIANVSNEYLSSGFSERVQASIVSGNQKKKTTLSEKAKKMHSDWIDGYAPIKDVTDYVEEKLGVSLSGRRNAYTLATNSRNARAIANFNAVHGFRNMNGNIVQGANSFLECIAEVDKKDLGTLDEYLVLKHSLEWINPQHEDVTKKRVFGDDTLEDIEAITKRIAEIEKAHPEMKGAAQNLYEYQRNLLLHFVIPAGGMTMATFKSLYEKYPCYVPFYRSVEETGKSAKTKGTFANQKSPLKRAKGSGELIISPLESIINNTDKMVKFALRNQTMQVLANYANTIEGFGKFIEKVPPDMLPHTTNIAQLKDKFEDALQQVVSTSNDYFAVSKLFDEVFGESVTDYSPIANANKKIVTVLNNGKFSYYQVHDDALYEAIAEFTPKQLEGGLKVSHEIMQVMKLLITQNNPVFAVTNMARDVGTAYKNSPINNPLEFAKLYALATKEVLTKGEVYKQWQSMGGGHNSDLSANIDNIKSALRLAETKGMGKARRLLYSIVFHPIETVAAMNDYTESIPRVMEFMRTLNEGGDLQEAIFNADDITTNFKKSGKGAGAKFANSTVMFNNAALQGLNKTYRTLTNKNKAERYKTLIKWATVALFMTAIQSLFNKDDEEEYNNLSSYKKNNFYNFSIGDGKFISLPKARENALLDSFTERVVEYAFGNDEAFYGFGGYLADQLLPPMLPNTLNPIEAVHDVGGSTVLGGLLDVGYNKNFMDVPIESAYDKYLPSNERYNEKTSKIAYNLGQSKLARKMDLSPKKIDHLLSSYTGIVGQSIKALGPNNPSNRDVTFGLRNKFISDSNYSTDVLNKLYENKDKALLEWQYEDNISNAIEYEQNAIITSYVSGMNKAIKGLPEDEQREGRKYLLKTLNNWNYETTTQQNNMLSRLEGESISDEYIFDDLPSSELSWTVNKQKYTYQMTPQEYNEYVTVYLKAIENARKQFGGNSLESYAKAKEAARDYMSKYKKSLTNKYQKKATKK